MARDVKFDSDFFYIKDNEDSIAEIKYKAGKPSDDTFCDLSNYSVIELYNPYFNNNNDVIEIEINGSKETVGFIFPLQSLDGEDYIEDKWKQISLYVAALWVIQNKEVAGKTSFLNIYGIKEEELLNENIPLLLVVNKHSAPSFKFDNYKLSFLLCGYTDKPFYNRLANIERQDFFFNQSSKIVLHNTRNIYTKKLDEIFFSDLLVNNYQPAFLYLVTYQCFELLMKEQKGKEIEKVKSTFDSMDLSDFKTLREFKKTIQELDNEKVLLSELFAQIKLLDNFKEDYHFFKNQFERIISDKDSNAVYLQLYMVRNSLFHYYRNFFGNTDFDKLLFTSYQILIELFISMFVE